jgi:hypothetical protein
MPIFSRSRISPSNSKGPFDAVTLVSVGFNAGIAQAQNSDSAFGQGADGYGKRFAANFIDQASSEFFKSVTYSELFRKDPRYY